MPRCDLVETLYIIIVCFMYNLFMCVALCASRYMSISYKWISGYVCISV